MAQLRVYELAKELGLHKHELVTKINELGLGITVNNPMTYLNPTEVDDIRSALRKGNDSGAKAKAEAPKVRARKPAAKKDDGEAVAPKKREAVDATPVAPIRRRRKITVDAAGEEQEQVSEVVAGAPAETAPVAAELPAAQPAPVVEKQPEPEVEEAPVAQAAPEAPVAEEAPAPSVEEPEVEEEVSEPSAPEEEPSEVSEPESEVEEQGESSAEDERAARARTPEEPRRPATDTRVAVTQRKREPARSGAQVVGAVPQSVLLDRLAAEGKDFSPGPKHRTATGPAGKAGAGKRTHRTTRHVVEGRDLYDQKSRRKRQRTQQNKKPAKTEITQAAEHKRNIRIEDAITVGDLAHQMGVKAGQVALTLIQNGMMANVNTMLDYETAAIVAEEFGYTVENVAFDIEQFYDTEPDADDTLKSRPPVVTVMGHVDHGKTSLLDAIRQTEVAEGEAGGITQHIGAYQVETNHGKITFLDTPGHEAFTALRARGAKATDIVVLVVAADDGVMPQTVEAINHSRAAGVPIIVAVNKIDKESANPDRVKQALTEYELIPEEWGGSTLFVHVSALTGEGVEKLVDLIALQAEVEELDANPDRDAQGLVIEAELDIGRGPVATVLVQRGTLRTGDILVSGQFYGRVRTMTNWRGEQVVEAEPSVPVEITGLGGVPSAGEPFFVVTEERDAKRITQNVIDQRRKEAMASRAKEAAISLEDLSAMIREGEIKELKVILKADVQGSLEAIRDAFAKLGNEEVAVKVIHSAVGGITYNDVNLAASSEKGAVVVGFNVRPDSSAVDTAEKYGVQILTYNIIYDAIEQIRQLLEGMLSPLIEEETIGRAEVRETFSAPKVGTIAGCYVTDGIIRRNAQARLLRDGRVVYTSTISTLRRFKDDVREVKSGFECGLTIENFNDIKVGDEIEVFQFKEVAATLD